MTIHLAFATQGQSRIAGIGLGLALSLALFRSPAAVTGTDDAINPFPETRAEIAAYKEYLIKKYHNEICRHPKTATEISTLKELFEYAGQSDVHVKMKPGVYPAVAYKSGGRARLSCISRIKLPSGERVQISQNVKSQRCLSKSI